MPQEGSLFPHLTVAANVGVRAEPPQVERGTGAASAARSCSTRSASAASTSATRTSSPAGSSSGSRWPGRSPSRPEVVLLDEPFASLDAHLRASVRADVQQLLKESGTTTVLVTHDQDEALSTADRVAVLRDGGIAQCDAPQELYSRPVDADMARFIGEANLIPGILNGSSVQTLLGVLAVTGADAGGTGRDGSRRGTAATGRATGPAMVLIRPEQVELVPGSPGTAWRSGAEPGPAGPASGTGLTGRITGYGYHGHDAVVTVQPEQDPQGPPLTVRTLGGQALSPGSRVTLRAHGPVIAWPQRGD